MTKPQLKNLEVGVIFRTVDGWEGLTISPVIGLAVSLSGHSRRLDPDTPISHYGESQNRLIQWRSFNG